MDTDYNQDIPTNKITSTMVMNFWGNVIADNDRIRAEPSENCDLNNPLYLFPIPVDIPAKPGQLITIYAHCDGLSSYYVGDSILKKKEFYIEATFAKNGICDSVKSIEVFKEQRTPTAFTVRIPHDADIEDTIHLNCYLKRFHPGLSITLDTQYILT